MQEENLYTPRCIRTFSGKYLNVFRPQQINICIEDIAHALAEQPRFGGHLQFKYSVAMHSLRCCELAPHGYKLTALLHDSPEFAINDLASPIKKEIDRYNEIEHGLMTVIAIKFGLSYPFPDIIKQIDNTVLVEEWNALMIKKYHWVVFPFVWLKYLYLYLTAKRRFLKKYHQLMSDRQYK